jgi:glycosyltransferase involved in cell wall biosynthesis
MLDCEITLIGRRLGSCCNEDNVPFRTKRFRMLFRKGFLFYSCFNLRLFFYLLFNRFDILVANDLDTLLPNYIISKLKRLTLVYDSHEYFTGVPELTGRPFVTFVWKTIERSIFPHLKHVMTVSDTLSEQYDSEYGIRPAVIRNCSRKSDNLNSYSRNELNIDENTLLLILQGGGINIDKGGEELIEAVRLTPDVSLFIIGSGDILQLLKQLVLEKNLTEKIKFIPKLPWNRLMAYTKSADVGMCLEKDTNLNYRFSIPNKLFDYISAGIPVITGDLPEINKIVGDYGCGIAIPEISPEAISKAIIKLRDNKKLRERLRKNSVLASMDLNWENESRLVRDFYAKILSSEQPPLV